jgi:hypothetical protein
VVGYFLLKSQCVVRGVPITGRSNKSPGNNLNKWTLYQFTEVAADLELIREETAIQIRITRDYRNLIRPGVFVRNKIVCNRGTALSALAGLEHTINDIRANSPQENSK